MSTGFLNFFDTPFGHALSGVRVQKVQKVHRVQRVVVAPCGRRLKKGGAAGPLDTPVA